MDDRIRAVTAYPITGGSCGNLHVTAPLIKPSFRGRMSNRSIALDMVQVSNWRNRSSCSRDRSPLGIYETIVRRSTRRREYPMWGILRGRSLYPAKMRALEAACRGQRWRTTQGDGLPHGAAYLSSSGISTPSFFTPRRSGRGGPCRGTLTSTQSSSPWAGCEGSGTCSGMKKATGS